MWYYGGMDKNFVSNVDLRKAEDKVADQLFIDKATPEQHSIPRGVLDRLQYASQARTLDTLGWKEEVVGTNLPQDIKIINDTASKLRKGVRSASIKTIGVRSRMDDIARKVIKMQNPELTEHQQTPKHLDKIKIRLGELEELSMEIDKEISHIGAIVAIKDSYLHQLRVAKDLMARADMNPDGDEALSAAATIVLHTIPKRYNTGAKNANGRETIDQVISRLEDEVAELNEKVAEERFEVGLEIALLDEIKTNPDIDIETLNKKADQAVDRYVEAVGDVDAAAINSNKVEGIKQLVLDRLQEFFHSNIKPDADKHIELNREVETIPLRHDQEPKRPLGIKLNFGDSFASNGGTRKRKS